MATRNGSLWRSVDWFTIVLCLVMMALGWLSICGASYDFAETSLFSFSSRAGKQLVWIGCALVVGIILLNIEKKYYEMSAYFLYGAFVLLLIVTIFIAPDTKGSHSWLVLGPVKIQPAEFAKFATALALSRLLGRYDFSFRKTSDLLRSLLIVGLPMLLIIAQAETGSALVYLAFFLVLYREGMTGSFLLIGLCAIVFFVVGISQSGKIFPHIPTDIGLFVVMALIPVVTAIMLLVYAHDRRRALIVIGASAAVTLIALLASRYFIPFNIGWVQIGLCAAIFVWLILSYLIERRSTYIFIALFAIGSVGYYYSTDYVFHHVLKEYQQQRIRVVLGMEEDIKHVGYNVHQSKIAIGSGGLSGKGFLNGTQTKLSYVPEQETDFIFCTIGEEQGFIGSVGVLLLLTILILRILALAERQGMGRFGRAYGYSVACILTLHVLINIGMVIGFLPVIGIPLPFFSYGGSSLWGFTILIAIFLRMEAERNVR